MSSANVPLKQAVVKALHAEPDILLAILFGSVADGRESADSDIDIAVDLGHAITVVEKMSLISRLAEIAGRPIDLIDLQTAGEPLLGQILQHGERILGSNRRYADLIRKHLFDEADFLPYRERILRERRQTWIGK